MKPAGFEAELRHGLEEVGRRLGVRIRTYADFATDMLVVKAEVEPGKWTGMKISRRAIEDGEYITMLRMFVEELMCASKGSTPVVSPTELARYQQLAAQQQAGSYNQYLGDMALGYQLTRQAVQDNQYKQEFKEFVPEPTPEITAKELTKEELRARVERKLDLDEAKITTAAEMVSHGRWRRVMDEVFKEDGNKGGDDAERKEEAGSDGGRKRGDGTGGHDAG